MARPKSFAERDFDPERDPNAVDEVQPPSLDLSGFKPNFDAPPLDVKMGEISMADEPRVDVEVGMPEITSRGERVMELPEMDFTQPETTEQDLFKLEQDTQGPPETTEQDLFNLDAAAKEMEQPPTPEPEPGDPSEWAMPDFAPKERSIKDQVAEYLTKRPKRESHPGWAMVEDAANMMAGTKGRSFYNDFDAAQANKQKDFDSDRNAQMDLVKQAIQNKFSGGQNDLNRQVDYAKMDAQALQSRLEELGKMYRNATNNEVKKQIAEESMKLREALNQRNIDVRKSEGALQRENTKEVGAAHDRAMLAAANMKAVDAGVSALGKVETGPLKAAEELMALGDANPSLWDTTSGARGWVAEQNIPGISAAAAGGNEGLEFRAKKEQAIAPLRHAISGANLTTQEAARFNKALGDVSSSNGAVAKEAFRALVELYREKVQRKEAAVRPEARQKFQQNLQGIQGNLPSVDDEDDERIE